MQREQSSTRSAYWKEGRSEVIHRSLDHLLGLARHYRNEGCNWQAMDIFWKLSEDHAGTTQSMEAQMNLLEMAESYERHEEPHAARAVYERLSDSGADGRARA